MFRGGEIMKDQRPDVQQSPVTAVSGWARNRFTLLNVREAPSRGVDTGDTPHGDRIVP